MHEQVLEAEGRFRAEPLHAAPVAPFMMTSSPQRSAHNSPAKTTSTLHTSHLLELSLSGLILSEQDDLFVLLQQIRQDVARAAKLADGMVRIKNLRSAGHDTTLVDLELVSEARVAQALLDQLEDAQSDLRRGVRTCSVRGLREVHTLQRTMNMTQQNGAVHHVDNMRQQFESQTDAHTGKHVSQHERDGDQSGAEHVVQHEERRLGQHTVSQSQERSSSHVDDLARDSTKQDDGHQPVHTNASDVGHKDILSKNTQQKGAEMEQSVRRDQGLPSDASNMPTRQHAGQHQEQADLASLQTSNRHDTHTAPLLTPQHSSQPKHGHHLNQPDQALPLPLPLPSIIRSQSPSNQEHGHIRDDLLQQQRDRLVQEQEDLLQEAVHLAEALDDKDRSIEEKKAVIARQSGELRRLEDALAEAIRLQEAAAGREQQLSAQLKAVRERDNMLESAEYALDRVRDERNRAKEAWERERGDNEGVKADRLRIKEERDAALHERDRVALERDKEKGMKEVEHEEKERIKEELRMLQEQLLEARREVVNRRLEMDKSRYLKEYSSSSCSVYVHDHLLLLKPDLECRAFCTCTTLNDTCKDANLGLPIVLDATNVTMCVFVCMHVCITCTCYNMSFTSTLTFYFKKEGGVGFIHHSCMCTRQL